MIDRPKLDKNLDGKTFREFYYLKEELVDFCRRYGLPTSGGKLEITERIAHFLDTGEVLTAKRVQKKSHIISDITTDTKIEPDFVCSEKHRAFLRNISATDFLLMLHFRNGLKAIRAKLTPMRLLRIIGYLKKRKTVRQKLTSSLNTIHI